MTDRDLAKQVQRQSAQEWHDMVASGEVGEEPLTPDEQLVCNTTDEIRQQLLRIALARAGMYTFGKRRDMPFEIYRSPSYDGGLIIQSPSFSLEPDVSSGLPINYGWQMTFDLISRRYARKRGYTLMASMLRDDQVNYTYVQRVAQTLGPRGKILSSKPEKWYEIDTNQETGRVVKSCAAAQDRELKVIKALHQTDPGYVPPKASPMAIRHCAQLVLMAQLAFQK